ncbi:DNA polymerase III subunit psi [Paraferrimonas haliotis]|uniref:DNA polymerase III subunit psi n=1 Tax=Paraferrimonas haliotis TaxID=2013866 RepID=A0AA37TL87_9GAMM|nr:DNA polymerase III subunit psi [Paraferrimonas haliotis]GLS83557.1 hypothetical protein GCM10007894_15340 [Paraferrimonas haliotis]
MTDTNNQFLDALGITRWRSKDAELQPMNHVSVAKLHVVCSLNEQQLWQSPLFNKIMKAANIGFDELSISETLQENPSTQLVWFLGSEAVTTKPPSVATVDINQLDQTPQQKQRLWQALKGISR